MLMIDKLFLTFTMSKSLITDSFPIKKRTEPITTQLPQKKAKKEAVKKLDDPVKVYPDAEEDRDLDILRDFDTRCEYGPCIGITRLQRWKRAEDHNLEPPTEVREILMKHKNDTNFTECIWHNELM